MVDNTKNRIAYIDNLRIVLIMLVIAHHAGQPYGPTGGEWPLFNQERSEILGWFFYVNASFLMGLFFLISGYFVPSSFNKKGIRLFIKDKFIRLGIPLVFMTFILFAPLAYQSSSSDNTFFQFLFNTYLGKWQLEFGHMWFVFHLLAYSLCYALFKSIIISKKTVMRKPPNHLAILLFIIVLTIISGFVRIWFPIDRWVNILWTIPAEIAHLPQYVGLFILGIIAKENNWFNRITISVGYIWLFVGIIASLTIPFTPFQILWESLICIGFCFGLITLFRNKFNVSTRFLNILAQNTYTVYIIHVVIVVGVQMLLVNNNYNPFLKFLIVTTISIPICFLISYLIRKIPKIKRIL